MGHNLTPEIVTIIRRLPSNPHYVRVHKVQLMTGITPCSGCLYRTLYLAPVLPLV